MSGGTSRGVSTALADLLRRPQGVSDDGQGELLDPAEYGDDLPGPTAAVAKSGPKGGRPRGARNKSTEQIRRYILANYKHPLIAMAEMWSRTPEDLAKELGLYERSYYEGDEIACHLATGEAARLQQAAMVAALPYLAQKMPIAIEAKVEQRGLVMLGDVKDIESLGRAIEHSPLGGDGE